jgi:hypothetical protein
MPFSGGGSPTYLEVDKLPDGLYRQRSRNAVEYQEL